MFRQEQVAEECAVERLRREEEELARGVRNLELDIQQEDRVNTEIETFLREQQVVEGAAGSRGSSR